MRGLRDWRPDRSHVLLVLAASMTGGWGLLELLGDHPDYGLLAIAAPLWAAWATYDRNASRREARSRRSEEQDQTGPGVEQWDQDGSG